MRINESTKQYFKDNALYERYMELQAAKAQLKQMQSLITKQLLQNDKDIRKVFESNGTPIVSPFMGTMTTKQLLQNLKDKKEASNGTIC